MSFKSALEKMTLEKVFNFPFRFGCNTITIIVFAVKYTTRPPPLWKQHISLAGHCNHDEVPENSLEENLNENPNFVQPSYRLNEGFERNRLAKYKHPFQGREIEIQADSDRTHRRKEK
ncbi:hypothetical protein RIF29_24390 [Crotalaria pallida]|uniref:Uncharacterized protein n=1 Tax=Crotalaria pallida TaxID=3830 RepID=A0AAN9HWJ4_CROPI